MLYDYIDNSVSLSLPLSDWEPCGGSAGGGVLQHELAGGPVWGDCVWAHGREGDPAGLQPRAHHTHFLPALLPAFQQCGGGKEGGWGVRLRGFRIKREIVLIMCFAAPSHHTSLPSHPHTPYTLPSHHQTLTHHIPFPHTLKPSHTIYLPSHPHTTCPPLTLSHCTWPSSRSQF